MTDPNAPYGRDMGGAPLGQSIDDRMAGKPDLLKQAQEAKLATVDSKSDNRIVNNTMRHTYRVLSDEEKAAMQEIKDMGLAFHDRIAALGNSREVSIAKTKVEEAVMWAVKSITA